MMPQEAAPPTTSISGLYHAWAQADAAYLAELVKVVGELPASRSKHWQEPPSEACRQTFRIFKAARAAYIAAVEAEGDPRLIAAVIGKGRP